MTCCPVRAMLHGAPSRSINRPMTARAQLIPSRQPKRPLSRQRDTAIRIPELCTAERLANELNMPVNQLIKLADSIGERIDSPGRPLTTELMELLAMEAGANLDIQPVDVSRHPSPSAEEYAQLPMRPPVVTLMGHVDHGKTSLLDALRGTNVAAAELGGITQGITAFMVDPETEHAMTFIDTPGHELFAAMRQRGAAVTDIIILVIAVDAGIQPTTVQAIEYARETGSPLVVAANKMDRPDADQLLRELQVQLLEHGVVPEEMGGDTPIVGISATKRLNLSALREAVLLQAEMLELRADDVAAAEAVVLEATIQKGLGNVASVIIQRGTLRIGDAFVVGHTWGKVKTLAPTDDQARIKLAATSMPVRLSGFKELPRSGDELLVVASEAKARQISEHRGARVQLEQQAHEAEQAAATAAAAIAAHESGADAASSDTGDVREDARNTKPFTAGRTARPELPSKSQRAGQEGSCEIGDSHGVKLVPALLKADTSGALEAMQESLAYLCAARCSMLFPIAAHVSARILTCPDVAPS